MFLSKIISNFKKFSPKILHGRDFPRFCFQSKPLTYKPTKRFFWKKWKQAKPGDPEEQGNKSKWVSAEEIDEEEPTDFSKEKNLKYLIDDIKENNKKKPLLLPPQDPKFNGKKTVVLEMDETLLYSFYPDEHEAYLLAPSRDHDYFVDLPEHQTSVNIYLRNHFHEFLAYLKENCEPILFCNGTKAYVDKVMDIIDKERVFVHRIYQDSCDFIVYKEENLNEITKDLDRLNRDLSKVILIDARPFNFWCNPDNCK